VAHVDTQNMTHSEETCPCPDPVLTDSERRVLVGVAAGLSTREIAAMLFVSRQAVAYHIGNLLRKFQAGNRAGLVSKAFVAGVLSTDGWPPYVTAKAADRADRLRQTHGPRVRHTVSVNGWRQEPVPRMKAR
jgi:DNA-binding CsgD family transcriptional regulator